MMMIMIVVLVVVVVVVVSKSIQGCSGEHKGFWDRQTCACRC